MLLLPSVSETKRYRRFFIYKLWGVSSVGRASVLQAEGRRFETCTLHLCRLNSTGRVLPLQGRSWEFDSFSRYWTISITDRILRYERRGIGSTPIWSTQKQMLLFNNNIEWEKTGTSLTRLENVV